MLQGGGGGGGREGDISEIFDFSSETTLGTLGVAIVCDSARAEHLQQNPGLANLPEAMPTVVGVLHETGQHCKPLNNSAFQV